MNHPTLCLKGDVTKHSGSFLARDFLTFIQVSVPALDAIKAPQWLIEQFINVSQVCADSLL